MPLMVFDIRASCSHPCSGKGVSTTTGFTKTLYSTLPQQAMPLDHRETNELHKSYTSPAMAAYEKSMLQVRTTLADNHRPQTLRVMPRMWATSNRAAELRQCFVESMMDALYCTGISQP